MNKNKPIFIWNKETGIAECYIKNEYGTFVGTATCHPDDQDMMSEKVGCEIAYSRAAIKSFIYERDCIIKPSIKALKQLYYSMKHSKNFNPKSYETKMLWGQLKNWQYDLDTIKQLIDAERKMVNAYIDTKEKLYQNIRKQRKDGQN